MKKLENIKNTKAEFKAILYALENMSSMNKQIILYTDCLRAVTLFKTKKSTKVYHNEFLNVINLIKNVEIMHIDGHKKIN